MVIRAFPPIEDADVDGLLAIGGDLEVESLLLAYRSGIFPWPFDEEHLAWFAPPRRGILQFENLHVGSSFQRAVQKTDLSVVLNRNFPAVIEACSIRPKKVGTWITRDLIAGYVELHHAGYAHSVECYRDENLVGGVYGVCIGAFFSAESMFYREENASKIALFHLLTFLQAAGLNWIDVQVLNPLTKRLGGTTISRKRYLQLLKESISKEQVKLPNNLILRSSGK